MNRLQELARQGLAALVIGLVSALLLVSTACPEDDIICFVKD